MIIVNYGLYYSTIFNKNRQAVYLFKIKLIPKAKFKLKERGFILILRTMLRFSVLEPQPAHSMGSSIVLQPMIIQLKTNNEHLCKSKIIPIVKERLDKIHLTHNNKIVELIYINSYYNYINEKTLRRLKDVHLTANLTIVTITFVVYITIYLSIIDAFAILSSIGKFNAPNIDLGFEETANPPSTQIARIPTQAHDFNDMSLNFNKPKMYFCTTEEEALKLLRESYSGKLEITADESISEYQAAKKLYHRSDFGINPENKNYGMTKDQLNKIKEVGLTNYIRLVNPPPPIELIKDFSVALKNFCTKSEKLSNGEYHSRGNQKIYKSSFYYNEETRTIVAFNKETQDLITGSIFNPKQFAIFRITRQLGRL